MTGRGNVRAKRHLSDGPGRGPLAAENGEFFLNFFYVSYLLNVTPALSVANNLNGTRTASIFLLENGRRKMSPKLVGVDIFFL